jgi:RecA/RadA recombinase
MTSPMPKVKKVAHVTDRELAIIKMRAEYVATHDGPAAPKISKAKDKALATLFGKLAKKYKGDVFTTIASGSRAANIKALPSGWRALDDLLTGETDPDARTIAGSGLGWPRGRIVEIYGEEGCLAAGTFINYQVRRSDGSVANSKGGTIERLYERFHGLSVNGDGRGKYNRVVTEGCDFFAPCINDEDRIFQNRIVDVVKTGERTCYEVETESGRRIEATADHRFFVGDKYVRLSRLRVGSTLFKHDNTHYVADDPKHGHQVYRPEWVVKHHPHGSKKVVKENGNIYTYYRFARSRAVVEAALNALSLEEYRRRLNDGQLTGLKFIDPDVYHVHHINEIGTDDRLDNLVVLEASEHNRQHTIQRHNDLRFVVSEDRVVSIKNVGKRSTYDVKMEAPFNNYVANDLVVHNCGKTSLTLQTIAAFQKAGEEAAFVDAEHALDVSYAAKLGVDLKRLRLTQPDDGGERALDIVMKLCASGLFGIVVVDSVSALTPQSEIDADFENSQQPGRQAALMSRALRRLTSIVRENNVLLIFINQIRMKFVRFGNPKTTSGGQALKFYASIRLDLTNMKTQRTGDRVTGRRMRVRTVKNKCAPPFRSAYADLQPNRGFTVFYDDPDFGGDED